MTTRTVARPRVRRLRRQAVRKPTYRPEPCPPAEWRITERPVVLRELWAEPAEWPLWQELSVVGFIVAGLALVMAGGGG